MNPDETTCPYCLETIKAGAIKCRYCGSDLRIVPAPLPASSVLETSRPSTSVSLSTPNSHHLTSLPEEEIMILLTSLVDKSLVVYEEATGRYRLLETVRQYGRDCLFEGEEGTECRARHAQQFLSLAEKASPQLQGPEQAVWLERLETEHENLRAALRLCLEESEGGEDGLRLSAALQTFWMVRGHLSEGRELLTALLSHSGAQERTKARSDALNGAGNLAHSQGDYTSARTLHEESLRIRSELRDRRGIAGSLNNLGSVAKEQGDYASARALYEEALRVNREIGNRVWEATNLMNLGNVALYQGDSASAHTFYQESLEIQRELGNKQGIAASLHNLGIVVSDQGDYPAARALYAESLAIHRELGNRAEEAITFAGLGNIAYCLGDYASARSLHGESLEIRRELGDRQGIATSLTNLGTVVYKQGDNVSARTLFEESLEIQRELGDRRGIANSLNCLGNVANELGDYASAHSLNAESLAIRRELGARRGIAYSLESFASLALKVQIQERAAQLWGAACSLREEIGSPLPPSEREKRERDLAAVREVLGEQAFSTAWQAGREMTLEQAIEYVLS